LFHNAFSALGNECFADRPLRFAKQVRGAFPPLIVERDDGRFQIGLHDDAPGPFPTRSFAQSVIREAHHATP
jgi:hypothetical protein